MGLDIHSSDRKMNFHIGYIGFSIMRAFFVLPYGDDAFLEYRNAMATLYMAFSNDFHDAVGDLIILIDHSDCGGRLDSQECQKLIKCLKIDEDKIRHLDFKDKDRLEIYIRKMYDFRDIVNYCAENKEVELIFC